MRSTRLTVVVLIASLHAQQTPAPGPLRVHPSNPRWFADPSGKAVLLGGSHVWQNLVDNGLIVPGATSNPAPVFDYTRRRRGVEGQARRCPSELILGSAKRPNPSAVCVSEERRG